MHHYTKEMHLFFELRDMPASSREAYLRRLNAFLEFTQAGEQASALTLRDVQEYILYLKQEKKLSAGSINNYLSAIRFFYTHVLGKEWDKTQVPRMKRVNKLPVIPSRQDVTAMLTAAVNLKHKAVLALLYGSGLRVSEVARLKIGDICSKTMRVRVDHAKHGTNRYTILSQQALLILRDYYRAHFTSCKPDDWLFPGRHPGEHLHVKSIKNTLIKIRNKLGYDTRISAHTLRHAFATHCLENGTDPVFIQQMLGHKNLQTTTDFYLHLTSKSLLGISSPLDTVR